MFGLTLSSALAQAGGTVVLQALAVIGATFILEDATTVGTALAVQAGQIDVTVALISLYIGIALGDLGLFGLGRAAAAIPWLQRFIPPQRQDRGREWLEQHLFKTVFAARFTPGARLPAYTACGFLRTSFRHFALAVIGATLIWTSLLFGISLRIGAFIMRYPGFWRWAGAIGFILAVVIAGQMLRRARAMA